MGQRGMVIFDEWREIEEPSVHPTGLDARETGGVS
jgi:hypothetical protein